ncbi:hypothetical protein AVEN_197378-1 [Araneus ventricosus]|uniref:Uncharacterized protein n=1 Tax=Araneus ventricosus TaxID=182803 RepID=A0A4Y2E1E6_ARAVE|nr:hypothetical protein AVEN_197378-1 [Araneus ventricosus]
MQETSVAFQSFLEVPEETGPKLVVHKRMHTGVEKRWDTCLSGDITKYPREANECSYAIGNKLSSYVFRAHYCKLFLTVEFPKTKEPGRSTTKANVAVYIYYCDAKDEFFLHVKML